MGAYFKFGVLYRSACYQHAVCTASYLQLGMHPPYLGALVRTCARHLRISICAARSFQVQSTTTNRGLTAIIGWSYQPSETHPV